MILTSVMATTWTDADIATLEAAIASGVLSVNYAGPPARSVTYQSMDAMLKALEIIRRAVSGSAAVPYRLVSTTKGL